MIFNMEVAWNGFTLINPIIEHLRINDFKNNMGGKIDKSISFGYNAKTNQTGFIIEGFKSKSALVITIHNEAEKISFMGGIMGKYLPKVKQLAQYKAEFTKDQLAEASTYFETIVKEIGVTNE